MERIMKLTKRAKTVIGGFFRKTFKPKEFGNTQSLFSLGTMSTSYWDLAEEFKEKVIDDIDSHKTGIYSKYAFPAIIMYCSAVEALINESLSLKGSQTTDGQLAGSIAAIKNGLDDNRDLLAKTKNAYKSLSRDSSATIDENILQNFRALSEVRNAIVHYNPDFIDVHNWPIRLQEALKRSRVEPIMGDWTITFRTKPVLLWAEATGKTLISEFLRITNVSEAEFFNQ